VIGNLPNRLAYVEEGVSRPASVILAGGEVLLDPVRESVLYPALDLLGDKYGPGGVKLIVQTTGDLLTSGIVRQLLDHGVWTISISGIDHHHAGLEEEPARQALRDKITAMMAEHGVSYFQPVAQDARAASPSGRYYHFFGATPDAWIGRIWPRGRAQENELSTATLSDNFCNAWSGGLNFLNRGRKGSEVSIDPEGNVYPCCIKTRLPVGNLLTETLDEILDRCSGDPVYEAINTGQPQKMGIGHGWSEEEFLRKSRVVMPSGRVYQNLCIGCDRFHEEVLAGKRGLVQIG
jgi:sulfatase maturation enzyme AslB (radical SAM superfamily)